MKLPLDISRVNAEIKDDSERTPLLWAAKNGHEAVVKLLLDTGTVDVDIQNGTGWTLLSRAARTGHEAVVKLLLVTGVAYAKPSVRIPSLSLPR